MKISEHWLRSWANPKIDSDTLAEQLTMAGFEVEAVEYEKIAFDGVIVAGVESVKGHPDSDKLHLCQVNDGSKKLLNIVCGAANVRAGLKVALAKPGAVMPGGTEIKKTKIRGQESEGMICSMQELGLGDESEGIWELPNDADIGKPLKEIIINDDHILELALTPNRGDCLSVAGIAREVSVINNCNYDQPVIDPVAAKINEQRKVVLDAASACPHYAGRIINGVNASAASPLWLTERLRKSGIRSINAIVDITNYVMLELGQPMHAFDNDNLQGDIHVRFAKDSESLVLLDQQTVKLNKNVLVIADNKQCLAMAGIMGGLDSAVDNGTQHIFLESAYFDPIAISGQARKYGLYTDSSHRFERGVDYTLQVQAIERATILILEICGGDPGPVVEATSKKDIPQRQEITLKPEQVKSLIGIDIAAEKITSILQGLDFNVDYKNNQWKVIPPARRFDVSIAADLIEEITRIFGYQNIPGERLGPVAALPSANMAYDQLQRCRLLMTARGYQEAITFSFVDDKLQNRLFPDNASLKLANPISAELSVMRSRIISGLIPVLTYNTNRQQDRVRIFETGLNYQKSNGKIIQKPFISGLIYGNIYEKQWDSSQKTCDYFDIKMDVETLLALAIPDLTGIEFRRPNNTWPLHPGQSSEVLYKKQVVGVLGGLHPEILHELDIGGDVYVFELDFSVISTKISAKYQKLSKFPAVKRDIAIVVDQSISAQNILECIKNAVSDDLTNLELFDVYRGEGIDSGKKSVAIDLTFQRTSSTLTDEEVESMIGEILLQLKKQVGGSLRE